MSWLDITSTALACFVAARVAIWIERRRVDRELKHEFHWSLWSVPITVAQAKALRDSADDFVAKHEGRDG